MLEYDNWLSIEVVTRYIFMAHSVEQESHSLVEQKNLAVNLG